MIASLLACPATAQEQSPSRPDTEPHSLARWFDAQTLTVSARYNRIEDGEDRTLQNRLQTQVQVRARLKLDESGRYGIHAGLFTGNGFDSGWNPTGIGTGDGTANIYLKHLFITAKPWNGIDLQYGSMDAARGESSEITSYDSDAYLTAGRVIVRRPRELFFDDVTVSVGYVGYLDTPFVFDRGGAFSRQNYWQLLASKQLLPTLTLSTDYSAIENDGRLRQAATWRVGEPFVDTVAGEYGVRVRGGSHQTAFAFSGQKRVAGVTLQLGYANVDPDFGELNGDRYRHGNRVFTSGSFPLPGHLSASWFVQKEISPPATSSNNLRVDLILTWDVLKTLKPAFARATRSPARKGLVERVGSGR